MVQDRPWRKRERDARSGGGHGRCGLWDPGQSYQRVILRDMVVEVRLGLHPLGASSRAAAARGRQCRTVRPPERDRSRAAASRRFDYDRIRDAVRTRPLRGHPTWIETLLRNWSRSASPTRGSRPAGSRSSSPISSTRPAGRASRSIGGAARAAEHAPGFTRSRRFRARHRRGAASRRRLRAGAGRRWLVRAPPLQTARPREAEANAAAIRAEGGAAISSAPILPMREALPALLTPPAGGPASPRCSSTAPRSSTTTRRRRRPPPGWRAIRRSTPPHRSS